MIFLVKEIFLFLWDILALFSAVSKNRLSHSSTIATLYNLFDLTLLFKGFVNILFSMKIFSLNKENSKSVFVPYKIIPL